MTALRLFLCGLACLLGSFSVARPSDNSSEKPSSESKNSHKDIYGEALPEGAIARLGTVRFRHAGAIAGIGFSGDSRTLITSGKRTQFWDVATGRETKGFPSLGREGLALSPIGKMLAEWEAPVVYLRDEQTGRLLHKFGHEPLQIATSHGDSWLQNGRAAFSPDGALLAIADKTVQIWDTTTGKAVCTFRAEGAPQDLVAFAPDGRTVVSTGRQGKIYLWSMTTKKSSGRIPDPQIGIGSMTFSRNGRLLATVSADPECEQKGILIRDVASSKTLLRIEKDICEWIAFTPDVKGIFAGSSDGLSLYNVSTGKEVRRYAGNLDMGLLFALSGDGTTLAAASMDSEAGHVIQLWNVATGRRLNPEASHNRTIAGLGFSPDGTKLASAGHDAIRVWDWRNNREAFSFGRAPLQRIGLAWAPDGKRLTTGVWHGDTHVWDAATGKQLKATYGVGIGGPARYSPDGKLLAARDGQGLVCIWEVANGEPLRRFGETNDRDAQSFAPMYILFAPSGKAVLTFGIHSNGVLWDIESGKLLRRFGDRGDSNAAAFSPDGTAVALGSDRVTVWNVATRRRLLEFAECDRETNVLIHSIAYSPDGRMIAIGDGSDFAESYSIRLWEVATGRERYRYTASKSGVSELALAPDGRVLASTDEIDNILIWDVFAAAPEAGAAKPDLERCWKDLDSADAALAFRAIATLVRGFDKAVQFLAGRLKPSAHVVPLDKSDTSVPSGDTLRGIRAIEVLEYIGTADAQKLLRELATGEPAARLTREAKASLARLETRKAGKP